MITKAPLLIDPLKFAAELWPDVRFYKQQREIIYSVVENDDTFVVAGNMLGKDFVAGFLCVWFFLTRHPCRIVTTSTTDPHLDVLWGEIGRFICTAKYPLTKAKGGPLVCVKHSIRKVVDGEVCPLSYLVGKVASPENYEAFQGHHIAQTGDGIPRTMFMADEASGVRQAYWSMASTWMQRSLIFGNPWACNNFFYHAVKGKPGTDDKGGDIPRDEGEGFYRKVFRIKATHSPNVRLAMAQKARGESPTGEIIVPGVLPYHEERKRRKTWDKHRQTVSLDAEFYEDETLRMFPAEWIDRAHEIARKLGRRQGKTMGVDSGEGSANTSWAICDDSGLVEMRSMKTPDTSKIASYTIAFAKEFSIKDVDIAFDRGGGGKQHADYLRARGWNVVTVGFGESATPPKRRGVAPLSWRVEESETQYTYKNRRAEMYGLTRIAMDPSANEKGFAIPAGTGVYARLREQMEAIPLTYDGEGRIVLPPKNKPGANSQVETLIDLIGYSPDELDALVLGVYKLRRRHRRRKAGAA